MNLDESLREIIINTVMKTAVAQEGVWYEAGNISQAIAKIKALVVESLPKEINTDVAWVKNEFDKGNDIGLQDGFNRCLGEIRSIYEDNKLES